jgi:hypothetical protein
MVKRYVGGVLSANTFSVTTTSASGFFNSSNHIQYKQASVWPAQYLRPATLDYLIVAGGGAGGGWIYDGGGGGAGGLVTATGVSITSGTLSITVGSGGAYTFNTVTPGQNSNISGAGITNTVATGGGGGSSYNVSYLNGGNGGSGGGSSGAAGGKGIYPGSSYIDGPRQGYDGGTGNSGSKNAAGGGGGAGSAGAAGIANGAAGKGGDGLTSALLPSTSSTTSNTLSINTLSFTVLSGLTFTAGQAIRVYNSAGNYMWGTVNSYSGTTLSFNSIGFVGSGTYTSWTIDYMFSGGGGGSSEAATNAGGAAGAGGGGKGAGNNQGFTAGATNSGGGAGGGYASSGTNGGSGIVIIRHPSTSSQALSYTGTPTIYTSGGYTIYMFTGSGSLTF